MTTWKTDKFFAQGEAIYAESREIGIQRSASITDYEIHSLSCLKCDHTSFDVEVRRAIGAFHVACENPGCGNSGTLTQADIQDEN